MKIKAKNCPFCNKRPRVIHRYVYRTSSWDIDCDNCDIRMSIVDGTRKIVVEQWNNRLSDKRN